MKVPPEQDTFSTFYQTKWRPVFGFMYRALGNVEDAQQCAQETFTRLYRPYQDGRKLVEAVAHLTTASSLPATLEQVWTYLSCSATEASERVASALKSEWLILVSNSGAQVRAKALAQLVGGPENQADRVVRETLDAGYFVDGRTGEPHAVRLRVGTSHLIDSISAQLWMTARHVVVDHFRTLPPPGVSLIYLDVSTDTDPDGGDEGSEPLAGADQPLFEDPDPYALVLSQVLSKELWDHHTACVEQLPDRQRECWRLWMAGHRQKAIAAQLSVAEATVRTNLHRAKTKLRQCMAPYLQPRRDERTGTK